MRFMSAISVRDTMTSRFWRQSEQPINNQLSTINRLRECAAHLGICHFICRTWPHKPLDHLKKHDGDLEDPGDEIGPESPAPPIWVFGFTISIAIAGSCRGESDLPPLLFLQQMRTCPPKPWRRRINQFQGSSLREHRALAKLTSLFPWCPSV